MRTISLLPSATEVVAAIGCEPSLVGRSHRCNYPRSVERLPVVTESTLEAQAGEDAGAIDAVVEDHHHGEHSYFRVNEDVLADLQPELLLTQSVCEVCAVPESMTVDAMGRLDPTPELLSLDPTTIAGIFESIRRLGATFEADEAAHALLTHLEARIEDVVTHIPESIDSPRVVCLEWTHPPRSHGLWIPDILERLRVADFFGTPGGHGRRIEWADVCDYDPEVLIVSPCGRTIPQIIDDMAHLVDRDGWSRLSAVQSNRVFLLDGEISSRHGPRVVRAMELMAEMVYPNAVPTTTWADEEARQYPT